MEWFDAGKPGGVCPFIPSLGRPAEKTHTGLTMAHTIIKVFFDGGFCPAHRCYGSWEVEGAGVDKKVIKMLFTECEVESSNTAEYLALVNALGWLNKVPNKKDFWVKIYTDSMLVRQQLVGAWQTKPLHLKKFVTAIRENLSAWGEWTIDWHGRANNVKRFGH